MAQFDLKKVLADGDSMAQLLSCNRLDISFGRVIEEGETIDLKNNSLDLGHLYLPDIPIDGDSNDIYQERYVHATIAVRTASVCGLTISSIDMLPEIKGVDCPSFIYQLAGDGSASVCLPHTISSQHALIMRLSVKIPLKWSGCLIRTIIFKVAQTIDLSPIAKVTTEVLCGVRVLGCVVTTKCQKVLSTDAKPFIPVALLRYFDHPPYSTFAQSLSLPSLAPNEFKRFSRMLPKVQLSQQLWNEYVDTIDKNKLADLVHRHSLHVGDGSDVYRYLRIMGTLILYEELHLNYDICNYDLHHKRFEFSKQGKHLEFIGFFNVQEDNYGNYGNLKAKFRVKGSSENRPNISIGDFIYLRPANISDIQGSIIGFKSAQSKFDTTCGGAYISLQENSFFEFVGTVVSYKLSTEEVIAEFLRPLSFEMYQAHEWSLHTNQLITPKQYRSMFKSTIELLSSTPFHCRFSFDKSGFYFIKMAINTIANDRQRLAQLFPNPDQYDCYQKLYEQVHIVDSYSNGNSSYRTNHTGRGALNAEQSKAVSDILFFLRQRENSSSSSIACDDKSDLLSILNKATNYVASQISPLYVIYGPPGTGKTICVVEAVLAALVADPYCRILACAPSDAAADVICDRLAATLSEKQMFRLCFWKKSINTLPARLFKYACMSDGLFELPSIDALQNFSVIVTTCGSSGILSTLRADSDTDTQQVLFDLVIIDEASQATESESLVPLICARADGVVVLCGDSKQLAAQTRSPMSDMCSKYTSLQERLLLNEAYRDLGYTHSSQAAESCQSSSSSNRSKRSVVGTFLTKNYRSHESIINLSSRLFYNSRIEPLACKSIVDSLLPWQRFPLCKSDNFACLMVGVNGAHSHDIDSPSFFNVSEIKAVLDLVGDLIRSPTVKVSTADIGVICAFRAQVLRMRVAMREAGFGEVNIGSVEDFQGQECRVVIISTVLSQKVPAFVNHKGSHGMCGDFRKFNVAITRGIALTVVVGNPFFLASDWNWNNYMNYCDDNGCYTGCACPLLKSARESDLDLNAIAEYTSSWDADPVAPGVYVNSDLSWRLRM